jgi:L-alanine-DL-glutamate epimerase-like enolase superfamily enzyme
MKITDVRTVLLTGPSSNEEFFGAVRKSRSASFIEIETDGDLTGVGETYLGYFVPEAVPELVEFFKPILVGLTDKEINPRKVWERMYRCANYWARSGAGAIVMAGIEGALWDLRGKMDGVPVYELLGGCLHERLLCYATGGPCPYPWTELKRRIDGFRAAGFRGFKVATGYFDPVNQKRFESAGVQACVDLESEKLEVIRAHAGKDFVVCLDGHMSNPSGEGQTSWDAGIAKAVLSALEPYELFFFEEPLHYNNVSGYAELRRNTATPVAGGEALTSREEFWQYAQADAFDIAQPDAAFIGIWAFLDVARMFANLNKRVATHAWASGAGVMQNIHAAFATPNMAILETPPLPGPLHTEVYADGYRFQDGYMLPPQAPGLGVRLTDSLKAKYPFVRGSGEFNVVPGKTMWL